MDRFCSLLVVVTILSFCAKEGAGVCRQHLNSSSGTIQPPKSHGNVNCTYEINTPSGDPVILRFLTIDIPTSPGCVTEYIEVVEGKENIENPARYCGKSVPRSVFAVSGVLTLRLVSKAPVYSNTFKAEFSSCTDCIKRINSTEEQINYVSDPDRDPLITDFVYLVDTNRPVTLQFTHINLDRSEGCKFEYVQVKDGPSYNSPEAGTYCGQDKPEPIFLSSGQFSVIYHTEEPYGKHGFNAYIYGNNDGTLGPEQAFTGRTSSSVHYFTGETSSSEQHFISGTPESTFNNWTNEDNTTRSLPILSRVLEGKRKSDEEGIPKTAIYVISTVAFCIVTLITVNGLIVWKRRSRRRLMNKCVAGLEKYATLHKNEQNPPEEYMNENINIIYNPNYVVTGSPEDGSAPCVITKIENVDSTTSSILDDNNKSPADPQAVKSSGDPDIDYALEEGSYYVLNITSKNKAMVPGKMDDDDINSRKKSREYSDVGFEDDSRLHSTDTSDKIFAGVTLKISDVHQNL